jgi:hypothetical protein
MHIKLKNPTKNRGWTQVLRKGRPFLLPLCILVCNSLIPSHSFPYCVVIPCFNVVRVAQSFLCSLLSSIEFILSIYYRPFYCLSFLEL